MLKKESFTLKRDICFEKMSNFAKKFFDRKAKFIINP